MFDNINLMKKYCIDDSITGASVEVVTFNASLEKDNNINMTMNVNYPHLYAKRKEEILVAYRQFCADVSALGATMGLEALVNKEEHSVLKELSPITEEFRAMATKTFEQVIKELGNIEVNPVPEVYNRYSNNDMSYRY